MMRKNEARTEKERDNLTICALASHDAYAYVWDETQGKKGCCEIATVILQHLSSLPSYVTHMIMYSDCCSGQNRNQFLTAALWKFVQSQKTIKHVENKYLESGHTHMEADSVHGSIERAKTGVNVYVPHEWQNVIHMARRNNPCVVIPLQFSQFLDIKSFVKNSEVNLQRTRSGERVQWLNVKHIKISLGSEEVLFRYNFHDQFKSVSILPRRNRRGMGEITKEDLVTVKDPMLYSQALPITQAKKDDLLKMCRTGVIPDVYHQFYTNLTTDDSMRNALAVPDAEESDRDTE